MINVNELLPAEPFEKKKFNFNRVIVFLFCRFFGLIRCGLIGFFGYARSCRKIKKTRSEERRVGKECKSRWAEDQLIKKREREEEKDSVEYRMRRGTTD